MGDRVQTSNRNSSGSTSGHVEKKVYMVSNIVDLVKDYLSDDVLTKIAGHLGEGKSGVASAAEGAVSSVLAGLMQKGSDAKGAESILQTITEGERGGGILNNLGSMLDSGSSVQNLISSGGGMLNSIFGSKAQGVTDMIASKSGISKTSGWSLTALLAPLVMGVLGKTLRSEGGLNAGSLMNLLRGQKDYIKGLLPAGLTGLLGISEIGEAGRQAVQAAAAPARKLWPWALAALGALVLFILWRGMSTREVAQTVTEPARETATAVQTTAEKAAEQARQGLAALGAFSKKTLPDGVELDIPELGVENKLIGFIEDKQRGVDETTWFSFDRLTFDTGKATLRTESQEQLKNVAEIMKAYPNVKIKLGGYTDNVGDPQANLTLSQQRADAVKTEIAAMGVDPSRMESKGYGEQHPVADNSTEEGRAKNRRIDINVTVK
jgi:OOP family OmpA-OmpF porin